MRLKQSLYVALARRGDHRGFWRFSEKFQLIFWSFLYQQPRDQMTTNSLKTLHMFKMCKKIRTYSHYRLHCLHYWYRDSLLESEPNNDANDCDVLTRLPNDQSINLSEKGLPPFIWCGTYSRVVEMYKTKCGTLLDLRQISQKSLWKWNP